MWSASVASYMCSMRVVVASMSYGGGGSGDPTRYHIKGKIVSDRAACRS
jgi:hypothetical protein